MKDDLFIEIGLEEMPSSEVMLLSEAFSSGVLAALKQQRLSHSDVATYATPRRIALWIKSLQRKAQDIDKVVWGPSVDIAFKENGLPSKAGAVDLRLRFRLPRGSFATSLLHELLVYDRPLAPNEVQRLHERHHGHIDRRVHEQRDALCHARRGGRHR